MVRQGTGCVLVMDAETLVGIFTAWDLARLLASPGRDRGIPALMQVPLVEYMSQPVVTIADSKLNDSVGIRAIFAKTGVSHLPVVDGNGYPVGMVSWAKVMGLETVGQGERPAGVATYARPTLSDWSKFSNLSGVSDMSKLSEMAELSDLSHLPNLSNLPDRLPPAADHAALERMEQQLKQIFAMGHDLRSPLNVILGLTQLMATSPELSPAQKVNVETISNSGYQLLKLINQVLRLTQTDSTQTDGRLALVGDSNGAVTPATPATIFAPHPGIDTPTDLPGFSSRRVIGLAPNQRSYRVLIVDDQPSNCRLLRAFLSVLKVEVQEANDGKDAIALWQTWQPHLIWMDVQMPVTNGYEATQAIRQLEQAQAASHPSYTPTKIIALTASARKNEDELAKAAGCDDFVRKPFAAELFFDKMALHLGWQYCYHNEMTETASPAASLPGSPPIATDVVNHSTSAAASTELQPTDLQIMSADWIEKIHRAALGCDDYQIKQLLTEIPETHGDLRHKLDLLIHNYQFDQIIYSVRAIQR